MLPAVRGLPLNIIFPFAGTSTGFASPQAGKMSKQI